MDFSGASKNDGGYGVSEQGLWEAVLGSREDSEGRVRADPKEGRGCGKRERGGEVDGKGSKRE